MTFTRRLRSAALLGAMSLAPALAQTGADGPAGDTKEQIQALQERIDALDQKVGVAERSRELDQEAAAAKAQAAATVTASRDGFSIRSASGDFLLKIGGYINADGRFYLSDDARLGTDGFLLRRVRPEFRGTLYRFIDFRLIPDFAEGKTVLQDAHVDIRFSPKFVVRAGKFKAPLGLERLQSDPDTVFMERGLASDLVPNRDAGAQVWGDLFGARLSYAVAVMNGTPDGASSDIANGDGKDYFARVFATPFSKAGAGHPLKGLGVGFAGSRGKQEGALATYKSVGQLTFFSFDSAAAAGGARVRYSPQAYYYYGRFGLLAEYVRSDQKVRKGAAVSNIGSKSWQVAGSCFLTGESRGYKSTAPGADFNPGKRGWGAWEIAARFEGLALDPAAYRLGLANRAKSAQKANAWGAGLNWYLNANLRLELNYEETRYTGGATAGDRPRERALMHRLQIIF